MSWLRNLRRQSDFRGDWYGALTNQVSHTAMASWLSGLFAISFAALFGEMPYRTMIILSVTIPYMVVELVWQRYENADSIVDIYMVSMGAAMVVLPFEEIGVGPDYIDLRLRTFPFFVISGMWLAVLVPYVIHRGLVEKP